MTREEIKNLILCRAYAGAFEEGVEDYFNLHKLAEENGIDNDEAWKTYEELKDAGLIRTYAGGGLIINTSAGLLYCEENGLINPELKQKQSMIRTKLLVALFDIEDKSPHYSIIDWENWIEEAGVNKEDFNNNHKILRDKGLIETQTHRSYKMTSLGNDKVREYKTKVKRIEDFNKLEKLEGVTPQERGHKLEDLLAETAKWEGWEVTKRARSQGQENDIIMHLGLHYFLDSCKWEAEPIQGKEVELLESRVRSRAQTNGGILFSMSGFTPNCIEEIRLKIATALIIPFGPADIKRIMGNEVKMTDLLDGKIDQVMNHRLILVDGELK